MPRIDFGRVDDVQDFSPLPDGSYVCHVDKVELTTTRAGDEMWKVQFAVEDAPFVGRLIFDNLVFSQRALPRVKLICGRLGVNVSGPVDLTPASILGKRARLTVHTEDYQDDEGTTKRRNVVPYAGYESVGTPAVAATAQAARASTPAVQAAPATVPAIADDDDLPF